MSVNTVLSKIVGKQTEQDKRLDAQENQGSIRQLGAGVKTVASASTITVGHGNYFSVTGGTALRYMVTDGWTRGSLVMLRFNESITIHHLEGSPASNSAEFHLNDTTNWNAGNYDVLGVVYDGSNWHEVFRRSDSPVAHTHP